MYKKNYICSVCIEEYGMKGGVCKASVPYESLETHNPPTLCLCDYDSEAKWVEEESNRHEN